MKHATRADRVNQYGCAAFLPADVFGLLGKAVIVAALLVVCGDIAADNQVVEDREVLHATLRLKPWISKSWTFLLFLGFPFLFALLGFRLWWLLPMWWAAVVAYPLYTVLKRLLPQEPSVFYRKRTRMGVVGRTVLLYGMSFASGSVLGHFLFSPFDWQCYLAAGVMLISLITNYFWFRRRRISSRKDEK